VAGDWVVVVLLAIAGVLLLSNLGNGYLWQDEAETAVLARNTLRFGYPRSFDGRSYIDIPSHGYGPGEAWVYNPWLPFYLLAGVFAVAGESTEVARLPFTVFGLISIYLTWRLVSFLTDERRVQRLSVALLTFSVPFLLHMRQCRYYAMTTALLLGVILAYLRFLREPSSTRAVTLSLLLVLLFHTNFGTFIPACAALILHDAVWGTRFARQQLWVAGTIVAVLTLPWALGFYRSAFVGAISLERIGDHLEYYVRVTNKYLVPLACMAVTSGLWWLVSRSRKGGGVPHRSSVESGRVPSQQTRWFLILTVGAQALFLLIPDQRHMRYLIPALPLLVIGEAWWLTGWLARSRVIGVVLISLALFTNVLQSVRLRVPLTGFIYELTHQYTGPMEGIVSYLREHGRPDQTVKIPYDDRTLMFYTGMKVERPSEFLQESYPDWVIIRRDWIPGEFFTSEYFHQIEAGYERIELDAPDILWQNREDPGSHHFRTVRDAPPVAIYKKRQAHGGGGAPWFDPSTRTPASLDSARDRLAGDLAQDVAPKGRNEEGALGPSTSLRAHPERSRGTGMPGGLHSLALAHHNPERVPRVEGSEGEPSGFPSGLTQVA
jgi:hypothetical protein